MPAMSIYIILPLLYIVTCGPGEHACKIRKVFKCIPDIDGDCIRDNEVCNYGGISKVYNLLK